MTDSPDPVAAVSFAVENVTADAVDRLAQVLDHHAARVFDQLQAIADRLGDLADRLERQP